MHWIATGYGALDLRRRADEFPTVEIAVIPTKPSDLIGLVGPVAQLWRRLVASPLPDQDLNAEEWNLVREFAAAGIASSAVDNLFRISELTEPWFMSPLHELLTALIVSVAREAHIPMLVIKGPVLHRQGLRTRMHSGDIDVLVRPQSLEQLAQLLSSWGWSKAPDIWDGTTVNHSVTLEPNGWGCEIDLHRRMPGAAVSDDEFFAESLWTAVTMQFAGVTGRTLNVPAHSVLYSLHAMRPDRTAGSKRRAVEESIQALQLGGPLALEFAVKTRCDAVLSEPLGVAFPDQFQKRIYPLPLNWTWRQPRSRVVGYWRALKLAPPRKRPILLAKLIWPPRAVVEATNRRAGLAAPNGLGSRLKRWVRAIR